LLIKSAFYTGMSLREACSSMPASIGNHNAVISSSKTNRVVALQDPDPLCAGLMLQAAELCAERQALMLSQQVK
jgi:hypothetical protein